MELFSPDRDAGTVFDLIARLGEIGISGRDASYLASVKPSDDPVVRANFRAEFRFMVAVDKRPEAARLVGLSDWQDPVVR